MRTSSLVTAELEHNINFGFCREKQNIDLILFYFGHFVTFKIFIDILNFRYSDLGKNLA